MISFEVVYFSASYTMRETLADINWEHVGTRYLLRTIEVVYYRTLADINSKNIADIFWEQRCDYVP